MIRIHCICFKCNYSISQMLVLLLAHCHHCQ